MAPFTVAANKVSPASTIAAVSNEGISSFSHHPHRAPLGTLCPAAQGSIYGVLENGSIPSPHLTPSLRERGRKLRGILNRENDLYQHQERRYRQANRRLKNSPRCHRVFWSLVT